MLAKITTRRRSKLAKINNDKHNINNNTNIKNNTENNKTKNISNDLQYNNSSKQSEGNNNNNNIENNGNNNQLNNNSISPRTISTLSANNENLGKVSQFKYLGSILSSDNTVDAEVEVKTSKAAQAFRNLSCLVWYQPKISVQTKLKLFNLSSYQHFWMEARRGTFCNTTS